MLSANYYTTHYYRKTFQEFIIFLNSIFFQKSFFHLIFFRFFFWKIGTWICYHQKWNRKNSDTTSKKKHFFGKNPWRFFLMAHQNCPVIVNHLKGITFPLEETKKKSRQTFQRIVSDWLQMNAIQKNKNDSDVFFTKC